MIASSLVYVCKTTLGMSTVTTSQTFLASMARVMKIDYVTVVGEDITVVVEDVSVLVLYTYRGLLFIHPLSLILPFLFLLGTLDIPGPWSLLWKLFDVAIVVLPHYVHGIASFPWILYLNICLPIILLLPSFPSV